MFYLLWHSESLNFLKCWQWLAYRNLDSRKLDADFVKVDDDDGGFGSPAAAAIFD